MNRTNLKCLLFISNSIKMHIHIIMKIAGISRYLYPSPKICKSFDDTNQIDSIKIYRWGSTCGAWLLQQLHFMSLNHCIRIRKLFNKDDCSCYLYTFSIVVIIEIGYYKIYNNYIIPKVESAPSDSLLSFQLITSSISFCYDY